MISNKRGFTLVEVVITVLILAVVFEILVSLVSFSTKFFTDENSQLDNQDGIRLVYLEVEKDLRKYGIAEGTVYLATDACYTMGVSTTVQYCFNATNQQVTRQLSGGSATVLGQSISNFDLIKAANSSFMDLAIHSVVDRRGQENDIDVRLYIRK